MHYRWIKHFLAIIAITSISNCKASSSSNDLSNARVETRKRRPSSSSSASAAEKEPMIADAGDGRVRRPELGGLLSLLNASIDARGEKPVLVTPGARQERATAAALGFLRQKKVNVERFTHARVLLDGKIWEVLLVEFVDKRQFGGYAYSVKLEEPSLRVVTWNEWQ